MVVDGYRLVLGSWGLCSVVGCVVVRDYMGATLVLVVVMCELLTGHERGGLDLKSIGFVGCLGR